LNEFEAGKYNVLFLNARNMGAGLNIDSASHVVLFHRMSPELESQIIGRALRLGRHTPLDVVHLLHDNELTRPHNILTLE
jgi:SNF2 family DNA or RNA helicase